METTALVAQARSHSLGDLPRRTARRLPTKTAIIDGDTQLTFAELDAVVDRAAAAMAAAGLVKGDRLALLSRNCRQFAVLDFATARLGVILVPMNFMLGGRSRLAGYKAPNYVVIADALPKNPSGKILKRELREQHANLGNGE